MLLDKLVTAAKGGHKEGAELKAKSSNPVACYEKPTQHVSQCHGAMAAMGITIGKNGQLVIANKKKFSTSKEPSKL